MRRLAIIGALAACLLGGIPFEAVADEKTEKALEERIKRLEKLVEELTEHEAREAKEGKEKEKEMKTGEKPLGFGSTGSGKLIYAKPFVSSPRTTVGGYMDLQYRLFNSSKSTGIGQPSTGNGSSSFDQQRFVPFFYSDITDRLQVAAELEIEHGIRSNSNEGSSIELSLELATMDDGLDNNNGKAAVGRVAFSPILGIEIGGSGYFGTYDPASKRPLAIWAADWTFQRGPFELIGEAAWVYARDNNRNLDGTFAC